MNLKPVLATARLFACLATSLARQKRLEEIRKCAVNIRNLPFIYFIIETVFIYKNVITCNVQAKH